MNGRVAKEIRRAVYGDRSFRAREYNVKITKKKVRLEDGKDVEIQQIIVIADAFRQAYQRAKKERRELRWKL